MEKKVECPTHGLVGPAFLCEHLRRESHTGEPEALGFIQAEYDPQNRDWDDLCGWCSSCDEALLREGEWNDASEAQANFGLVYEHCFERAKRAQDQLDGAGSRPEGAV